MDTTAPILLLLQLTTTVTTTTTTTTTITTTITRGEELAQLVRRRVCNPLGRGSFYALAFPVALRR